MDQVAIASTLASCDLMPAQQLLRSSDVGIKPAAFATCSLSSIEAHYKVTERLTLQMAH